MPLALDEIRTRAQRFTRESRALVVDTSLSGTRVTPELDTLVAA